VYFCEKGNRSLFSEHNIFFCKPHFLHRFASLQPHRAEHRRDKRRGFWENSSEYGILVWPGHSTASSDDGLTQFPTHWGVYLSTLNPGHLRVPIGVFGVSGMQQVAHSGEFRYRFWKYREICRFMANGVQFSGKNVRQWTLWGVGKGGAWGSGMGTMKGTPVLGGN